jgi:hypothetical protein
MPGFDELSAYANRLALKSVAWPVTGFLKS